MQNKFHFNKYLVLFISVFISAFTYNVFIKPTSLVVGGNNGIAVLVDTLFKIKPSITIFVLSFVFVIFSFIFLGKKDTVASLLVVFSYPILIEITKNFNNFFSLDKQNVLLCVIFAAVLNGIAAGLVYKNGLNNGGIGIIAKILHKKFDFSITRVNFLINIVIVLFGGYVFGFEMVLFAVIFLYINKLVCDRVLLGISKYKKLYIFSKDYIKVCAFFKYYFDCDAMTFDVVDKYFDDKVKMIVCIISTYNYKTVKFYLYSAFKYSFILVSDCYEVCGDSLV